jgi:hypothetical protein
VVRARRTTRCCVFRSLAIVLVTLASGLCPDSVAAQSPQQRREEIVRSFRETKVVPIPLVDAQRAWSLTLGLTPSAPGAMDEDRVYIPLRTNLLVAIERETGLLAWLRPLDTTAPVIVGGDRLFVVTADAIRALDATTGNYLWSSPIASQVTAPLVWDNGWIIALVAPGEVLAFRALDGQLMWRRSVGATSPHSPVPGIGRALYLSLADSRLVALTIDTGELLWERQLTGTLSPPAVGKDRVFVGSTDNFLYALHPDGGREQWKWRNGGDVIGAAVDGDVVYFASLDNILRAVNRGNGNQRWRKPTGTRPVLPPRAFRGIVVVPGLMPAVSVFIGETGEVMGTHAAEGDLVGPPLIDPSPSPGQVAFITITREGVVDAMRPTRLMFRETAPVAVAALPGRPLTRERLE